MKKVIITAVLICANMQLTAMDQNQVDISGLDKAKLLQALFDKAQPQGLSFTHYNPMQKLSDKKAQQIIDDGGRADYVDGRAMKVYISDDKLDSSLFNKYNGAGSVEQVVQSLRAEQQ